MRLPYNVLVYMPPLGYNFWDDTGQNASNVFELLVRQGDGKTNLPESITQCPVCAGVSSLD